MRSFKVRPLKMSRRPIRTLDCDSIPCVVFLPSVGLLLGIRPTVQPPPAGEACAAPARGSSPAPRHSHSFASDKVTSKERLNGACAFIVIAHIHSLMGRALDRHNSPVAPGPAPAASAPQRHAPSQAPAEPRRASRKAPEHRPILVPCLLTSSPCRKRSKPVPLKEAITQLLGQLRPCNPELHTANRWGAH